MELAILAPKGPRHISPGKAERPACRQTGVRRGAPPWADEKVQIVVAAFVARCGGCCRRFV